MSRARQYTDPAVPAAKLRETDPLGGSNAWAIDDSLPPLESSRAPMGTHELPPEHQTRVESPAGRQRTPHPRSPAKSSSPPPVPRRGDNPEARVGSVLGSYRLLELIGKGGMGYVYRAEHVKLGREVALKLLRADYARRRESVARFFQEARTVNRIRHRNIIDVTDFVELDDGTTFIIMELLRGQSLGRWARERFDLARSLALLVQICDGLAAAHAVGVIHRDLKPDNVIVVPTGDGAEQVKLLDFGVAKLVHRDDEDLGLETAAGSVIGTPAYMSPEQAGGLAVDERADIYSLGAIMYELFTGQQMFRGKSFGEYVRKHLSEQPVPPRATERGAGLPDAVETILMRCLEKDPGRRFDSIATLRDDLLGVLGGIETIDPATPRVRRPDRLPRTDPPEAAAVRAARPASPAVADASADALRASQLTPPARLPRLPSTVGLADALEPSGASTRPRRARWPWVAGAGALAGIAIGAVVLAGGPPSAATPTASIPPATPATPHAAPTATPSGAPQPANATAPTAPTAAPIGPPPPTTPAHRPFDVRFDATPSADVLIAGTSAPLCATPCTITVDPADGGPTDLRAFTLHRDGYVDHTAEIDLGAPLSEVAVTLTRAGGRDRAPRSRAHRGPAPAPVAVQPATPDPGVGTSVAPATLPPTQTPPPPPPPRHGPKVDPTATIDPFHQP